MFSCFSFFSACLLLCFTCFFSFLLLCFPCFSAFLLLCFTCFFWVLLLCFPCFSAFVLLCLSVPFYFYYSTFSFLQSCVFAALLPAPLLLFLSLLPLCVFFSFALFSPVCKHPRWNPKNLKKMLIRTPDKKTYMKPQMTLKKPLLNPKETINETLKKLWMKP